jgi:hypothetical protein
MIAKMEGNLKILSKRKDCVSLESNNLTRLVWITFSRCADEIRTKGTTLDIAT